MFMRAIAAGMEPFATAKHSRCRFLFCCPEEKVGYRETMNMLYRTLSASLVGIALLACTAQAQDIALAKNSMRLFGGPSLDYRKRPVNWALRF